MFYGNTHFNPLGLVILKRFGLRPKRVLPARVVDERGTFHLCVVEVQGGRYLAVSSTDRDAVHVFLGDILWGESGEATFIPKEDRWLEAAA